MKMDIDLSGFDTDKLCTELVDQRDGIASGPLSEEQQEILAHTTVSPEIAQECADEIREAERRGFKS